MYSILRNLRIGKKVCINNLTFLHSDGLKDNDSHPRINLISVDNKDESNVKRPRHVVSEQEIALSNSSSNPLPEEPTTCCMSGCANCVWLEYAEKLSEYYKDGGEQAIKEINEKIDDTNIKAFLMHELRMRGK